MADLPISGLPVITVVSSSYLVPVVSGSVTSQMTVKQIGDAYSSSLSGNFIPYAGATGNVNLGNYELTASVVRANVLEAKLNGGGSSPLVLKTGVSSYSIGNDAVSLVSNPNDNLTLTIAFDSGSTTKQAHFNASNLTVEPTYMLPDSNGTLALLSDISAFPYTGSAQITGSLGITGSLINGLDNQATGIFSHAEGSASLASGNFSHAEGFKTIASGSYSHAEGFFAQAYGFGSHAEGGGQAFGRLSHAEGGIAYATSSHAEGNGRAYGVGSHAEGQGNTYGTGSHAEGAGNAIGNYSHAEGSGTAYADYSHAEGYDTVASASYSSVLGIYNLHNNDTSLFVIGDGQFVDTTLVRHDLVRAERGSFQVSGSLNVSGSATIANMIVANRASIFDVNYNTLIGGGVGVTGANNLALGDSGLLNGTVGNYNIAIGSAAQAGINSGSFNISMGLSALEAYPTIGGGTNSGSYNTAIGTYAMQYIGQGSYNVALGQSALQGYTARTGSASYNVAIGVSASFSASSAVNNVTIGYRAGSNITTGSYNTIIGYYTGSASLSNTVVLADGQGNTTLLATGSAVTLYSMLQLPAQDPLPAASLYPNSFAVSASTPAKPYFSDGITWNALY